MKTLLIVGAGGYGRAIAEVASQAGYEVVGFVDDRWPGLERVGDVPVLARVQGMAGCRHQARFAVAAIGDNLARQSAIEMLVAAGYELVNIVHPRAVVSPSARLGKGITVMAAAVIGTQARIDDGAIVNAGAVIDHDAHVGRCAHVGIAASLGGGAVLGDGAWLKQGGALRPGGRVTAGTVIERV